MANKEKNLAKEEQLRRRISELEKQLMTEKMRTRAYELMIEITEAEEGISIFKKYGAKK